MAIQLFNNRLPRLAAVVLAAGMLGGCASQLASLPIVGLSPNAPARPEGPAIYPAVHDVPPPREQAVLEPDERTRMEKELVAARESQARAGPPSDAADARPARKKSSQAK